MMASKGKHFVTVAIFALAMLAHVLPQVSAFVVTYNFPRTPQSNLSLPCNKYVKNNFQQQYHGRSSLTKVRSAKVLPILYTSASAALIYRATLTTNAVDASVLYATAALSLFNLGPSDNKRIASAKRADKRYPPAVNGKAKQQRHAAKTWRSTVRIKTVGQLLGILRMCLSSSPVGILKGASNVMLANVCFFLAGGGKTRHDNNGNYDPMLPKVTLSVLLIDTVLSLSALIAAKSAVGTGRRAIGAGIFVFGATMGTLEGIASLLFSGKQK